MDYIIETSSGFVQSIKTLGGELCEVTAYTSDKAQARKFTKKSLKTLRALSFFRYYSMIIVIVEA